MSSQVESNAAIEKPSDPSPLMVELMLLRRRMVRDLEQFLSLELANPTAAWIRLAPRLVKFARPEYPPCC
jgi:hypothetical protein